jgi:DNA repair protein RadC
VYILLDTAQRDCTPTAQAALLQQMTSSGLFKILDQLREATAQQLEQSAAAGAAAAAATAAVAATAAAAGGKHALEALQKTAAKLFCFEVSECCAVPGSCWAQRAYLCFAVRVPPNSSQV